MRKQPFAGRRQRDPVGSAVEEPLTQLRFQPVDAPQYGGAMDAESFGRTV